VQAAAALVCHRVKWFRHANGIPFSALVHLDKMRGVPFCIAAATVGGGAHPQRLPLLPSVRLELPSPADVCTAVIQGVQHHSPQVIVIDEIGRSGEVEAARASLRVREVTCAKSLRARSSKV
jgi:hypothetical protein